MIIGIDASRANIAERTGTEWYAWHLTKRLPALLPSDHIRLYVREPLRDDFLPLPENVEIRILRWPPQILWSHIRLAWELLWHPPAVLFIPADTVPLVHPPATVTTVHDVAFERFPELYRTRSVQRRLGWLRPLVHVTVRLLTLGQYSASELDYHRWSVRHALRTSRKILTVSEFSKREIVDTLHADPSDIVVTPLDEMQPSTFLPSPTETSTIISSLGLPERYIFFIGRLEVKKNIVGMIKTYADYVHSVAKPIDFVLIGSPGHGWEAAKAVIDQEGISSHVHVLGYQPADIARAVMRQARALLFLSRYEGFGIPPLEAMRHGVPVVAARSGSLPEVLGPAARYVDPDQPREAAQALREVLDDPAIRQACIVAGRRQAEQFSWDRTARQTADVLRAAGALPGTEKSGTVKVAK